MSDTVKQRSAKPDLLVIDLAQKVAELKGLDPIELSPPLHTAIDTDAIESLFSKKHDDYIRVSFTYLGFNVTIEGKVEPRVTVA